MHYATAPLRSPGKAPQFMHCTYGSMALTFPKAGYKEQRSTACERRMGVCSPSAAFPSSRRRLFPAGFHVRSSRRNINLMSEAIAVHEAVKWGFTQREPVIIYFDSRAAGDSAALRAESHDNIHIFTRATQGLTQVAASRGQQFLFEHAKSHEGAPLNELVDDLAKASARGQITDTPPYQLRQEWYDNTSPVAEWAWLVHMDAWQRQQAGLPPAMSSIINFPQPESQTETQLLSTMQPDPPKEELTRALDATLCSHHIGAVSDMDDKGHSSNTEFAGKVKLLAQKYKAAKCKLVGLQETRSRSGGMHQTGDYLRVIPNTAGPAHGDVELWVDTKSPWDPEDKTTLLCEDHLQIFATGPQYMCVSIRSHFLTLDVVVAHAPYAWDTGKGTAEELHNMFWKHLSITLRKRPQPAPVLLLIDANLEVPHEVPPLVSDHQLSQRAPPFAHRLIDLFKEAGVCLPSTFEVHHIGDRHTHVSTIPTLGRRRIDYFGIPMAWSSCVRSSRVAMEMDTYSSVPDHMPVLVRIRGVHKGSQSKDTTPRFTRRWIKSRDPEWLQVALEGLSDVPVPPWSTNVNTHRQYITEQVHLALDEVPKRKQVQNKPYATPDILELAAVRTHYVRTFTNHFKFARRLDRLRVFEAWKEFLPQLRTLNRLDAYRPLRS